MKRFAPVALLACLALVVVVPFTFASVASSSAASNQRAPGAHIATAISTVTGIAISPLLGASAYGAYKWVSAKDERHRASLPWYAKPEFWLPALLLVGICAAKDALGASVPPGWKKPLDVLEAIENQFSGLIAAGAVVPFAIDAMTDMLLQGDTTAAAPLVAGGLATIPLAATDFGWLLNLLVMPFAIAVFLLVFVASHAINVLSLLSPWGAIDAGLKAARTAVLGLVALASAVDPWLGAGLSLVVIVVAYFVSGWAFRLTIFGSIFSWEFITRRRTRFTPKENENSMFSGVHFKAVPLRTFGRLAKRADGGLDFVHRPWLVLEPRVTPVPLPAGDLTAGSGAFFSEIVDADCRTFFTLPPRYRGHEAELARAYSLKGVQPIGLRKAWSALREMLGGRPAEPSCPQPAGSPTAS